MRLECRSVSYAFLFPISSRFPTTGFSILHSAQINTSRRHERDEHVRAIALMMVKMIAGLIADNKASPLQCVLINTVDPYAAISLSAPAIANSNYLFSIAIPSPFVLPFSVPPIPLCSVADAECLANDTVVVFHYHFTGCRLVLRCTQ